MSHRIAAIKRYRQACRRFDGVLRIRQAACVKYYSRTSLRLRETAIGIRESRIEIDRLPKEPFGHRIIAHSGFLQMPHTTLIGGPRVEAARGLSHSALLLRIGDCWSNGNRHRLCDLVLQCKDVGEIAIVALGPDVLASLSLNKLGSNTDAVTGSAQATFKHVAHAQLASDLLHVDSATFVAERGVAGDHEQRRIARQRGDDVL